MFNNSQHDVIKINWFWLQPINGRKYLYLFLISVILLWAMCRVLSLVKVHRKGMESSSNLLSERYSSCSRELWVKLNCGTDWRSFPVRFKYFNLQHNERKLIKTASVWLEGSYIKLWVWIGLICGIFDWFDLWNSWVWGSVIISLDLFKYLSFIFRVDFTLINSIVWVFNFGTDCCKL